MLDQLAETAAELACESVNFARSRPPAARHFIRKSDGSPVSAVDYGIQVFLADQLCKKTGIPVCGEENTKELTLPENTHILPAITNEALGLLPDLTFMRVLKLLRNSCDSDRHPLFWAVDPIDGTRGYENNEHFATVISLVAGGYIVLSILACPHLQIDGTIELDGPGVVVVADQRSSSPDSVFARSIGSTRWQQRYASSRGVEDESVTIVRSAAKEHNDSALIEAVISRLQSIIPGLIDLPMDSATKAAMVAIGAADGYFRLPKQGDQQLKMNIWDGPPSLFTMEAAGARITSTSTGRKYSLLTSNCSGRHATNTIPGFLAANSQIHTHCRRAIRQVLRDFAAKERTTP